MKEKDIQIISHLRKDARASLKEISENTQIPISTVFDRIKSNEDCMIKHTALINFEKVGYNSKNVHVMSVLPENRELIKEYLQAHPNVNNLYLTNSGYDYLAETVFRNQRETQHFLEVLQNTFRINDIKTFNIIEDIDREKFLSI